MAAVTEYLQYMALIQIDSSALDVWYQNRNNVVDHICGLRAGRAIVASYTSAHDICRDLGLSNEA